MLSIIFLVKLEIALGMGADGADLGGLGADDDVPAVAALPNLHLALFKDGGSLDVPEQCAVALLVLCACRRRAYRR